ncbi:MAG: oligopeptidase B [Spirochaetales bacterium]|nr:oligopeptidase B [Spirochaetales bacterium]
MKTRGEPRAQKAPKELEAHGDKRTDNYYWLRLSDKQKTSESHDEQTERVLGYLREENDYTKAVLAHSDELQEKLYGEIVGRIKQDDETAPYPSNDYWYYQRYLPEHEHPIHCRKKFTLRAPEEIMLDANERSKDSEYYDATGLAVSSSNDLMAFGEDTAGRRIYTIRIKNLSTGALMTDVLENTTGNAVWANDNKTLFYTAKHPETLLSERVYRHILGTDQDTDTLVYTEEDTSYYIGIYKSKSRKYLIIWNSSTLSNDYWLLSADDPTGDFRQFSPREDVHEYSLEHYHDRFYIITNWDSRNFRLMETDESDTAKSSWRDVIPHRADVLLEEMEVFDDFLVIQERKAGLIQLRVLPRNGNAEHYIDFDEPSYVARISVNKELDTKLLRFAYSSLTTPWSYFDYDMENREKVLVKRQEVVGGHKPERYECERFVAQARDGADIPISSVYRKDLHRDSRGPILLYGYGSYGFSIDAAFRSDVLSLLDRGFHFAIAHIRGGQEMGREWYENGKMFKKWNTFYDYIDCARFLIEQSHTTPDGLFAMGGSAGGLLMGAVINENPELFAGVVAKVPFVDVLTTMSDPSIPLTTNEYKEWGNPANREEYDYIKSYSPYDNVKHQKYPNLLVSAGLFDSQVQYWEPAKWVAKLREYRTGENLLLLNINMEAGHGGASGRFKRHRETALDFAFLLALAGLGD